MMRALIILLACAACSKHEAAPAPAPDPSAAPAIPAAELARGDQACKAYVAKVCACADKAPDNADLKQQCGLARALPDALEVGTQVAASPDSAKLDVLHAQDSIRKTVKECIEQTAKLPSLGCS